MHIVDIFIWYVVALSTVSALVSLFYARLWKSKTTALTLEVNILRRKKEELEKSMAELYDALDDEKAAEIDEVYKNQAFNGIDPYDSLP